MIGWLKDLFLRRRLERDLAEEIQQHLDEKTDALVAGGLSREDAALAARRAFGNVTRTEEQGRDVWRFLALEDLFADIRFGLRQLRKSPAFALASILTLALGIGANTTVFSLVHAVVLRPLPYPESDRLVSVKSLDIRGGPHPAALSYPTFFDFRAENSIFEHIVSYRDAEFTLSGTEQPLHLRGQIVSSDLFQMLHVQPVLGRGFLPPEEAAAERVVILSHELWRGRFGGDAAIVGTTLTVDGLPHTVVGVAPPRFEFPIAPDPVQMWTTLAKDAASSTFQPITKQRGARTLNAMARLKPGVSIEQAQAQMDTVAASLAARYPDSNKSLPRTYVRPEIDHVVGDARAPLFILLGAVGLVLVVACANIANLLLAHAEERAREFTVRAAVGAGRGRIVRQLITESLTLSLIGCAAGLAVAAWSIRLFRVLPVPRISEASIDARVLAFSLALAVITSVLFGLVPALRAASTDLGGGGLNDGSRTSTPGSDRLRHGLCVAQVALGLILVSGAGLLTGSFLHLVRRDLGFRPGGLLTFSVDLPGKQYAGSRQLDFHARLLDELRNLPGVTSSALATPLPLTGDQMNIAFDIQQRPAPPAQRPRANMAIVTPGFFRTFGVPVLEGRDFVERDDATSAPVLIVNRAFAERFFPGENALGKRIEPGATSDDTGTRMREIVGVVGNARQSALKMEEEPIYYFPYRQLPWCCPSVVVRSAIAPAGLAPALRGTVAALDKQLAIYDLRTADEMLAMGVSAPRFLMLLLGSFAGIALLLTSIGLYGVLASSVVTRTREMGVRMALGATRQQVLAIVLRRAMLLLLAGLSIGLVGAVAGNRLLSTMLVGVTPQNPLLIAAACVVLTMTAAAAAYLPARRAASIDPVRALHSE
jgi:putative ABC transport system permease protein